MLDRPAPGTHAVLVNLSLDGAPVDADLQEFQALALSAGARCAATIRGTRRKPDPRFFVGSGKAREIAEAVAAAGADVVLVNHTLSPSQERNLEREAGCRVVDRTGLILDIFAQRAQTFEGKLQVELAQLRHLSTRLVRGWTHLERQKGGIGLRGPGETQLETDRRLIGRRIRVLQERLEKIRSQRDQNRRARKRADCFTVALVGYTNAGKSTLFNALTGGRAYAADRLFATLDPKHGRIPGVGGQELVVIDTVGFIRDLPHELVAAFRATLEETLVSDLLLHVVDAADPQREEQMREVEQVLAGIGAADMPVLTVFNKIDLIDQMARVDRDAHGAAERIWVSAAAGIGLELLVEALADAARAGARHWQVLVPVDMPQVRARLHRMGVVQGERVDAHGDWCIEARLDDRQRAQLDPRVRVLALPCGGSGAGHGTAAAPEPAAVATPHTRP
ncbi:MAG: ribosome rescue GTPase HflX [Gammaproteobacteria bacterium]